MPLTVGSRAHGLHLSARPMIDGQRNGVSSQRQSGLGRRDDGSRGQGPVKLADQVERLGVSGLIVRVRECEKMRSDSVHGKLACMGSASLQIRSACTIAKGELYGGPPGW